MKSIVILVISLFLFGCEVDTADNPSNIGANDKEEIQQRVLFYIMQH